MTQHRAYVGMGSNLGERERTLDDAFNALGRISATRVAARSSMYVTAPIAPSGAQDDYCNAVAALDTALEPRTLLDALHAIEQEAGRTRQHGRRNMARTLDLDLLLYDDCTIDAPGLTVPHPRLAERAFVLVPLAEIAPDCVIPGLGPARVLLDRVVGQRIVQLSTDASSAGSGGAAVTPQRSCGT
jgi:2-amino-4-hydroxy-6-hydroxymethyldihydropteridine diphosphokinase